jgi:hypothetical protein
MVKNQQFGIIDGNFHQEFINDKSVKKKKKKFQFKYIIK